MNTYRGVVLAAMKAGELRRIEDVPIAAMIRLKGRTLLDWTVEALRQTGIVSHITVIGPPILAEILSMRSVDRLVRPEQAEIATWVDSLNIGESSQLEGESTRDPFLIIACNAPLLSSRAIYAYAKRFERYEANIGLAAIACDAGRRPKGAGAMVSNYENRRICAVPLAFATQRHFLHDALQRVNVAARAKAESTMPGLKNGVERWYNPATDSHCRILIGRDPAAAFIVSSYAQAATISARLSNVKRNTYNRVVLIINPHSGAASRMTRLFSALLGAKQRRTAQGGTTADYLRIIVDTLAEIGVHPEIKQTTSSQDAVESARNYAREGYDLVIAAGGDGTINAVVNGLANSATALAVIPLGTVNLFAIEMMIPSNIRSACQLIGEGVIRTIDLGKVNDRFFTSLAGVGFDALVIKEAEGRLKKLVGILAYPIIMARALMRYRFKQIHISIENENQIRKGYLFAVGNGKHYGGEMLFAPEASMEDGKLDFVIYKKKGVLGILKVLWGLRTNAVYRYSDVEYIKATRAFVHKHGSHNIHLDGDYVGKTPATILVAPQALRVVS